MLHSSYFQHDGIWSTTNPLSKRLLYNGTKLSKTSISTLWKLTKGIHPNQEESTQLPNFKSEWNQSLAFFKVAPPFLRSLVSGPLTRTGQAVKPGPFMHCWRGLTHLGVLSVTAGICETNKRRASSLPEIGVLCGASDVPEDSLGI